MDSPLSLVIVAVIIDVSLILMYLRSTKHLGWALSIDLTKWKRQSWKKAGTNLPLGGLNIPLNKSGLISK